MKLKITNTNKVKDFHCESQTHVLMHAQPHEDSLETIELLPLVVKDGIVNKVTINYDL
jgi:hypothetical protein